MAFVYYTAAGIILYVVSDGLLNWLEKLRGSLFPQRSLIFFMIIMTLSLVSFSIIESMMAE